MSSTRILLLVFSSGECWRNMEAKTVRQEAKMELWQGNSRHPMTKTTSLNFIPSNSLYCWVDKSQCPCNASSGVVAAATGSFFTWEIILKRIEKHLFSCWDPMIICILKSNTSHSELGFEVDLVCWITFFLFLFKIATSTRMGLGMGQTCPKLQYHTQITIPRNLPWTGLSSNGYYLESPGEKILEHRFVFYFELQTDEMNLQHSIRIPFQGVRILVEADKISYFNKMLRTKIK